MASVAESVRDGDVIERRFFLFMAGLLIAVSVIGFGYFKVSGKSTFAAPLWVHVHAVSMVGWLVFFAVQNVLVVRNDLTLHRRLGIFGAVYAAWIIVLGLGVGWLEVATGRDGVAIFGHAGSVALNWVSILVFAAMFVAAFRLRHRSDWHKRLMLCATICLTAPAYGRTLIMLEARSNLTFTLFILAMVGIAMVGDLLVRRRVHPAYLVGLLAASAMGLLIGGLPRIAAFKAFAESIGV